VSNTIHGNGLFLDLNPWLWGGGLVLLISAVWWIPFVASISRSINQMKMATEQIAAGRFDVAIVEKRRDELGQLGEAINQLAKRLEGFVTGQKRFLGDTAHELCAPIARLQMALGVLEHRADPGQQQQIDDLREELVEMSTLVNELLSFSKAGLRAKDVETEIVSLKQTVQKAIRKEASGANRIIDEVPEDLCVLAEPELLTRAVANVLRNAIRYAGAKGTIRLTAVESGTHVELTIADEGPGVPEAALSRIFDPFFRLDPSRTRETGGAGLGLAIVKTCVESCRGSVRAFNKSPQGLAVKIDLMRAG
jgi:two-component system sensor histidine kinase CpxA